MSVSRGVLLLLTVLICVTTTKTAQEAAQESDRDAGRRDLDLAARFFIKSYSTRTWTFLSSFTSTVPYTCYTTGANNPMACAGRRLRRSRKLGQVLSTAMDPTEHLFSSGSEQDDDLFTEERGDAEQKFFFRIYSTVSTTVTVTTFSTNRSVTISASIMCTFAGVGFNVC